MSEPITAGSIESLLATCLQTRGDDMDDVSELRVTLSTFAHLCYQQGLLQGVNEYYDGGLPNTVKERVRKGTFTVDSNGMRLTY